MANAWMSATAVAVVAGVVGFFVVLRGAAFQAHAIPNGAFAGAAAANLLSVDPLIGLVAFSLVSALGIASLGRRGHHDVATALALVMMLALGALFLSRANQYEPEVYGLLFGEVLGVSSSEIWAVVLLACGCVLAIGALFRPLLLSSVIPEIAQSRGVQSGRLDVAFLMVLAFATAIAVPVVGALLIFSLLIGPPAAARVLSNRPLGALLLGVGFSLVTVWISIAMSYLTNWPIGFFVGILGASFYGTARGLRALRRQRITGTALVIPGP